MLSHLPRPIHRAALWLAHATRLAWWSIRRAEVRGCNAIVVNGRGEVLLVRHSYQSSRAWMLPGGGIGGGESPEQAATREVAEETGCRIADARCFAVEIVPLGGARNHIHLVAARTADEPAADRRELLAAAFFALDALPDKIGAAARVRVESWRAQNSES